MASRLGQGPLETDRVGPHVLRYLYMAQSQDRTIPSASHRRNPVMDFLGSFGTLSGLGHRASIILLVVQVVLVDMFLMRYMQSYPDEGYRKEALMTLLLDVPVLCHMLWYWREDSAARSIPTQWMCYSWMNAAKAVVLFCRVMPRLPREVENSEGLTWRLGLWSMELNIAHLYSPVMLSNLLLITPMLYSIFMFRVSRCTFGSSFKRVTVDLILHYDMLWHVLFDMVDQVDMFGQSRLAEAFDKSAVVEHQRTLVAIQSVIPICLFISMVLQSQVVPGVSVDLWKIPKTWPPLDADNVGNDEHDEEAEKQVSRKMTSASGRSSSSGCSNSSHARHSQRRQHRQKQTQQQQQQQQQQQHQGQPSKPRRSRSQDAQNQNSTNSTSSWTWAGLRDRVRAKQNLGRNLRTVKFTSPSSSSGKGGGGAEAQPSTIGAGVGGCEDESCDQGQHPTDDPDNYGSNSSGNNNSTCNNNNTNDRPSTVQEPSIPQPMAPEGSIEKQRALYIPMGSVADERRSWNDVTPRLLGRSASQTPQSVNHSEHDDQATVRLDGVERNQSHFKLSPEWEDLEAGGRCSHLQWAVHEALAGRQSGLSSNNSNNGNNNNNNNSNNGNRASNRASNISSSHNHNSNNQNDGVGGHVRGQQTTPNLPACTDNQLQRVRADSFKTCPDDDDSIQGSEARLGLSPRRKKAGRLTFKFPLHKRLSSNFLSRGASRRTEKSGASNATTALDPKRRLFAQRERARRSRLQAILNLIQRHSIFIARKRATVISLFSVDLPFLALRLWIWIALDHTGDFTGFPGFGIKNVVCIVLNVIQFPLVAMAASNSYFTIQRQIAAYALRFGPPAKREGSRDDPRASSANTTWAEAGGSFSPDRNLRLGSTGSMVTSLYSPSELPSLASTPNPLHAFATPYTDNTPSGICSNHPVFFSYGDPAGRSHTLHSLDSATGTVVSGAFAGAGADLAVERRRRAALWKIGLWEAEQQVRKDTERSAGICAHFWTLIISFSCGLILAKGDHYIIGLLGSLGRLAL